jgi:predicted aldo/keto reductase-like oxidoreductase
MDCPSGVDIPRVLAQYNHYLFNNKNLVNFRNQYNTIETSKQAHNCTNCGACEKLCPQHIEIPKHMEEISALLA